MEDLILGLLDAKNLSVPGLLLGQLLFTLYGLHKGWFVTKGRWDDHLEAHRELKQAFKDQTDELKESKKLNRQYERDIDYYELQRGESDPPNRRIRKPRSVVTRTRGRR